MMKNPRKLPLAEWQMADSDRLKAIFQRKRAELNLTQEKIASELGEGVTQGAVSHFMNRRTALSLKAAVVFARMLQVPVSEFSERLAAELESMRVDPPRADDSLFTYHGSPRTTAKHAESTPIPAPDDVSELGQDRYALVPQYDAKAAAGLGSENPHVEIRSTLAFKREWLRTKGAKDDQLIVIYAEGQSMWPTINDRDVLLIDRSRFEPVDGQVFVLAGCDGAIVKRLIQGPLGQWLLRSDNEDKDKHPDRFFFRSEDNEHRIIGQVIWRGGDL